MTYFGKFITHDCVQNVCVCSRLSDAWIRWTYFYCIFKDGSNPTIPPCVLANGHEEWF